MPDFGNVLEVVEIVSTTSCARIDFRRYAATSCTVFVHSAILWTANISLGIAAST